MIKKRIMLLNIFLAVICLLSIPKLYSQSNLAAYFRFCGCSLKEINGIYTFKTSAKTPKCVNTILDQGMDFANNNDDIYLYADNIPEITNAITLAAWIMPEKLIYSHLTSDPRKDPSKPAGFSFNPIFTKGKSANIFDIYTMACDYDSLYLVFSEPTKVHLFSGAIKPIMKDNHYYHLAATYDMTAGKIYLYFNGKRIATHNYNNPLMTNPAEALVLGESFPLGEESFSGVIDEVRIYNKALSAFQVDSIYKTTNQKFLNLKDTSMCQNKTIELISPSGYTSYVWKHKTDSMVSSTYIAKESGNYILKAKDAANCTYIDTLKVTVYALPPANAGEAQKICIGSNTVLTATGGKYYHWNTGDTTSSYTINPVKTTVYSVTVTDSFDCSATDEVSVTVNPLPELPDISDTLVCLNEINEVILKINNPVNKNTYKWYGSTSGNDLLNQGVSYKVNNIESSKAFYIQVINADSCPSTQRKPVKILTGELPHAGYYYDPQRIIQQITNVNFYDSTGIINSEIINWNWLMGDKGVTLNGKNVSYTFQDPGEFNVDLMVVNRDGCKDTVSHKVLVLRLDTVKIPNVFTPNNDGINDLFVIKGIDYSPWELKIFNRWGRQVYQNNHYQNTWDADGCSEGVYYYVLIGTDKEKKPLPAGLKC